VRLPVGRESPSAVFHCAARVIREDNVARRSVDALRPRTGADQLKFSCIDEPVVELHDQTAAARRPVVDDGGDSWAA